MKLLNSSKGPAVRSLRAQGDKITYPKEMLRILEEHKNVLTLPVDAVHNADGKNYVYVLGENNIWETKWITVGLEGKDNVEITDGLSEGDMVILK